MFQLEHKIFIIKSYYSNGNIGENGNWVYSSRLCLNEFRERFPNFAIIERDFFRQLQRTVDKFEETGNISDSVRSGRSRVRNDDVIDLVRQRMQEEPTLSLRRLKQETNLSYGTCQTIVKHDLNMFPYKLQMFQELLPPDYQKRVSYCTWFNDHMNNDILDLTFFTDESYFYLSGYVNKQVMRMWSENNPNFHSEAPLHSPKIGVWVAMSRRRVIGPIFFQGTINAERYINQILNPFINQLHDDELHNGYFQQDNARPHVARVTMEYLRQFYDERLISDGRYPPRSCDLSPLDYFLFPLLKNTIFKNPVQTLDVLQERIVENCLAVTPDLLIKVFNNMGQRVNLCIQEQGRHFQHLL